MIYFKVSSLRFRFRFCYAIYSNKFRDIFRVEKLKLKNIYVFYVYIDREIYYYYGVISFLRFSGLMR